MLTLSDFKTKRLALEVSEINNMSPLHLEGGYSDHARNYSNAAMMG
jgi:hypothetical protein